MPVRFQKECKSGAHLLVWEALEDEITLLTYLPSTMLTDAEYLDTELPHKRLEILASRVAIRHLAKELNIKFDGIKKDIHGKPFLVNSSWQMSITHSKKFMAVIFHPAKPVGIDIEKPQEKMWRIVSRLYSEQEIKDIGDDLNTMSIYWSAKEALYKLYGKRSIDFIQNLKIHKQKKGLYGEIIMPNHHSKHQIFDEEMGDYILVWAI